MGLPFGKRLLLLTGCFWVFGTPTPSSCGKYGLGYSQFPEYSRIFIGQLRKKVVGDTGTAGLQLAFWTLSSNTIPNFEMQMSFNCYRKSRALIEGWEDLR